MQIGYVLHALPEPSQNCGSTTLLFSKCTSQQKTKRDVHPENNEEERPKSCLGDGAWLMAPEDSLCVVNDQPVGNPKRKV
jgi:hypothetical protein